MTLAIHALALLRPEAAAWSESSAMPPQLRSSAGLQSLPPSLAQRKALGFTDSPPAPRADVTARTLALRTTARLAQGMPAAERARVAGVWHAHATVDEEPLGSTALLLAQASFEAAQDSFSVGQLGGAALVGLLQLAPLRVAHDGLPRVLSASDRWLAPFDPRFGPALCLGDGAAALWVAPVRPNDERAPLALLHAAATSPGTGPASPWDRAPAEQIGALPALLLPLARQALAQANWAAADVELLIGDDAFGPEPAAQLAQGLGLSRLQPAEAATQHLSSAAPADTLARAALAAAGTGRPLRTLLWTAAPGGSAGVACLDVFPGAWSADGSGPALMAAAAASLSEIGDHP